ncbi:MAG: hypothetical protein HYX44_09340 [Aquabacterium sp.]|nr:hypothetical protein [Aquabacterium sp.]
MHPDWQTLVTLVIGLSAALYLGRRWWPGLRQLFAAPSTAPDAASSASACPSNQVASPAASCGNGCGQCGQQTPAAKDHRIHVVRNRQG